MNEHPHAIPDNEALVDCGSTFAVSGTFKWGKGNF